MYDQFFDFYHVVKNEDAYTFAFECDDWGFLVAADGLGGSGSTVHHLDDKQRKDLEQVLKRAALPEYFYATPLKQVSCEEASEKPKLNQFEHCTEARCSTKTEDVVGAMTAVLEETLGEAEQPASEAATATAEEDKLTEEDKPAEVDESAEEPTATEEEFTEEELTEEDGAYSPTFVDEMAPHFASWLDRQLASMLDNEDDTSALWASRIAIMRFVYYMLTHTQAELEEDSVRKEIVDFIYRGLEATRDAFDLRPGDLSGQCVLPTTLVCLRYLNEEDGKRFVQAVWVGDSRGYAFLPDEGLKQLTQDDEDYSGAINNLFALSKDGNRINTRLNYDFFALPASCALFVCSDGVFDPYAPIDNVGVEDTFLTALEAADSYEALHDGWLAQYTPMRHDDTTVAFKAFGFEDFAAFKASQIGRREMVKSAQEDYWASAKAYELMQDSGNDEPDAYVRQRANTRRPQISAALAAHLVETPCEEQSPLITAELKDELKDALHRRRVVPTVEKILSDLREDPALAAGLFRTEGMDLPFDLQKLVRAAEYASVVKEYLKCTQEGDRLLGILVNRIAILQQLDKQCETICLAVCDFMKNVAQLYPEGSESYNSMHGVAVPNHRHFYENRYKQIKEAITCMEELRDAWTIYVADQDTSPMEALLRKQVKKLSYTGMRKNDLTPEGDPVPCHASPANPPRASQKNICKLFPEDYDTCVALLAVMERSLKLYRKRMDAIRLSGRNNSDSVDEYERGLQTLAAHMPEIMEQPDLYLTEDAIATYGIATLCDGEVDAEDMRSAAEEILTTEDVIFESVLSVFLTCKDATIIDSYFNASRLRDYRQFLGIDRDKVVADHDRVMALLAVYEDVAALRMA